MTLDGKPLEKGQITFRPQTGTASPSAGADIVDGKFSIVRDRGLMPGRFYVEITASRPSGKMSAAPLTGEMIDVEEQYLPAKYNIQSTLEAVVTADNPNHITYDLDSK